MAERQHTLVESLVFQVYQSEVQQWNETEVVKIVVSNFISSILTYLPSFSSTATRNLSSPILLL